MPDLIEINGLTKTFGGKRHGPGKPSPVVKALGGLDISVREGEIFGLLGPDGAGKTTLLRIIAGLLHPTRGSVKVAGLGLPENADQIRAFLGYMSQRFTLYSDLSVEENLSFFAEIYGVSGPDLDARLGELYSMTRLGEFKDRPAGKLSGGMKQKLALMCTLLPGPRLLLLDEPTTGVDPISRREFWEILQSLHGKGVTIVTSTPYMDEAEWCTRIGLLHEGRFLACASPTELKTKFGGVAAEIQTGPRSRSLEEKISKAKGVFDVSRLGERIRVTADNADQMKILEKSLGEKTLLKSVIPTVEDVFLRLIKGAGR